jgi:hypothetical protein
LGERDYQREGDSFAFIFRTESHVTPLGTPGTRWRSGSDVSSDIVTVYVCLSRGGGRLLVRSESWLVASSSEVPHTQPRLVRSHTIPCLN